MTAQELISIIEEHYPISLQEDWDKSGLQAGNPSKEIKKVMVALDSDHRTIKEALAAGCDMLITHHPFLFRELTLDLSTAMGQTIKDVIDHDLVIYSSHTPLDKVSMNVWLAETLGLKDLYEFEDIHMARAGHFAAPLSFEDFIEHVKQVFHLTTLHVAGYKKTIATAAICGGSGSDFLDQAHVDAYLTGDLKYHIGEQAALQDKVLVDIGHHAEAIMVSSLAEELRKKVKDVEFVESSSPDYFTYY
jgi:dinuclear metal center YbgI/SA1388 family protein